MEMIKKRGFWKNLLFSVITTPLVDIVGIIIVTIFGGIDRWITEMQSDGKWWMIFLTAFGLSFIFHLWEVKIHVDIERRK
jgi:hypothetical protein